MCKRLVSWTCIVMVLGAIATSTAFAETFIVADQSGRAQQSSPDNNISDSSKITIRTTAGDPPRTYKSWVKFDVNELDVSTLKAATLTVTLFQDRGGSCDFDVSYINDDCWDNIDWDRKSLTWNNAPGNNTTDIGALDKQKTTWITKVQYANGVAGDIYTIDVLEALQSDTDGIVQFVFHNSSAYMNLCSHEHAEEAWRPFLTVIEGPKGKAGKPHPADGEKDVVLSQTLSWRPGVFADKHDVYFGHVFDDVNNASKGSIFCVSTAQDANFYNPGRLEYGRTYYWRVDEINAPPDTTVIKGDVWSFTTEPYSYPLSGSNVTATASSSLNADSGPQKTVDGSGIDASDQHGTAGEAMWTSALNQQAPVWIQYEFDKVHKLDQMWVWNSNNVMEFLVGLGVKTATVEYSRDGIAWTVLPNVPEFAQAPGATGYAHNTTVDFGGVAARFVRFTMTSNWGGVKQYGLSEVRFFYIPVSAREPKPATGATGVALDATLSWRAGREAAEHKAYLGADPQAVANGTAPATTVQQASYSPSLNLGTTYYWRVDEVNAAEAVSTWTGDVWSFTTMDYFVVDDMESYTDADGKRIYQTWVDGYGTGTNGSLVGNDAAPYANKTTVHGGRQSMPFRYANTGGITMSEATRTLSMAEDWTVSGINTLRLFFYGNTANTDAGLYVKINGTKVAYTGEAANVLKAEWTRWDIPLSSVPASSLKGVTSLTIGTGTGSGDLLIDDIGLYRTAPVNP